MNIYYLAPHELPKRCQRYYKRARDGEVLSVIDDIWSYYYMKLSARNQIKGTIVDIRKGVTTALVRVDIGGGVIITSSITIEAVDEFGLAVGQVVSAVFKASNVMIGVG